MARIYVDGKNIELEAEGEELEALYFSLVRGAATAYAKEGEQVIFRIEEGRERVEQKAALFSSDQRLWRAPTVAEGRGLLRQFTNLSALARRLDVARNTVGLWIKGGPIDFYRWRYLLELVGAVLPVEHHLDMIPARGESWLESKVTALSPSRK